jgi:hypothetical protein
MNHATCSASTDYSINPTAPAAAIGHPRRIARFIALLAVFLQPVLLHGAVIDYLSAYNELESRNEFNGIGQTFVAPDKLLTDASLLLVELPDSFPGFSSWWNDARFEVRRGLPGNFYGNDGNILFQSEKIVFNSLPAAGTSAFGKRTLYLLSLSQWGLDAPLAVNPGETYSLILINYGNPGNIGYAQKQPSSYPAGGLVVHNVAYSNDFWAGPYGISDLAFRVTAVPEPSAFALLAIAALGLLAYASRRQ